MRHNIILYDHNIFYKQPLNINKFYYLCNHLKKLLNASSIIVEKIPFPIDKFSTEIDKDRYITDNHDKLLIFAVAKNSVSSIVCYQHYDKKICEQIYNGRAMIIHEPIDSLKYMLTAPNNNLFSALICDFKYYNLARSVRNNNNSVKHFNSNYYIV